MEKEEDETKWEPSLKPMLQCYCPCSAQYRTKHTQSELNYNSFIIYGKSRRIIRNENDRYYAHIFLFKCHLPLYYKSESLVDVKADTCSWTKQTTIIFTYNGLYRTFIIMKMHGLWKLGISYCLHKGID